MVSMIKLTYSAPDCQAIEVEVQSVICESLTAPGFGDGGEIPFDY